MEEKKKKLSKFISLVLRHKPDAAGISLDQHGWAKVDQLLDGIQKTGRDIGMAVLEEIVRTDEKGRYAFNEDKTMIRARQGHSIAVDVELEEKTPPDVLYHGTATRYLDSIRKEGLKPMSRLYVHLSKDYETAFKVGSRHGKAAVLKVDAKRMYEAGEKFYLSANGIWLVKHVGNEYLTEL